MRIVLLFFILTAITTIGFTQVNLNVVTKRLERSFEYQKGYEVNVEGQKAEINIETWSRAEIQVIIEFKAKHPELEVAKADVEKMAYRTSKVKNKIYLRNYLNQDNGKPQSILEVKYKISLPRECPVYLKNHFGIATLSNLSNRLKINSSFTDIGLNELSGTLDVKTRFGDLTGDNLNTTAKIESRRSNITLNNIKGSYDIKASYGIVKVFAHASLEFLKIDAEKADVFAYHPNPEMVAYNISSLASELFFPSYLEFHHQEQLDQSHQLDFKPPNDVYSVFQINVRFGEIKIDRFRKP